MCGLPRDVRAPHDLPERLLDRCHNDARVNGEEGKHGRARHGEQQLAHEHEVEVRGVVPAVACAVEPGWVGAVLVSVRALRLLCGKAG